MHGYGDHGPSVEPIVLDCLRREAEASDSFRSVISFHSLAGGTGSGLGTFVTESIRDSFPRLTLLNAVVWPYREGEVVVQSLNAALSASHLVHSEEGADGLIILQNDMAMRSISRAYDVENPSLRQINAFLAQELLAAIYPATSVDGSDCSRPLSHLVSHLFANPLYRLSLCAKVPTVARAAQDFEATTWKYVRGHLLQTHITQSSFPGGIDWMLGLRLRPLAERGLTQLSLANLPVVLTAEEERRASQISSQELLQQEWYRAKLTRLLEKYPGISLLREQCINWNQTQSSSREKEGSGDAVRKHVTDPRFLRSYSAVLTLRGEQAFEEFRNIDETPKDRSDNATKTTKTSFPRRAGQHEVQTSMQDLGFHHPELWSSHGIQPLMECYSPNKLFG